MNLAPCPFCGGAARIEAGECESDYANRSSANFRFTIRCRKCGATAPHAYGHISLNIGCDGELNVWHDDRPAAAAEWNRRAGG